MGEGISFLDVNPGLRLVRADATLPGATHIRPRRGRQFVARRAGSEAAQEQISKFRFEISEFGRTHGGLDK